MPQVLDYISFLSCLNINSCHKGWVLELWPTPMQWYIHQVPFITIIIIVIIILIIAIAIVVINIISIISLVIMIIIVMSLLFWNDVSINSSINLKHHHRHTYHQYLRQPYLHFDKVTLSLFNPCFTYSHQMSTHRYSNLHSVESKQNWQNANKFVKAEKFFNFFCREGFLDSLPPLIEFAVTGGPWTLGRWTTAQCKLLPLMPALPPQNVQ